MTQSLRDIKRRIRSVEGTAKITRAMEMVSVSKLRRTENTLFLSKPYFARMGLLLSNLLAQAGNQARHPFLEEKKENGSFALFLVASDTGLSGVHNENIIRFADSFISRRGKDKLELIVMGRKAFKHFNKIGVPIRKSYLNLYGRYSTGMEKEIADTLAGMFLSGEVGEVYAAYTHFESALRHKPVVEKLLSLPPHAGYDADYITDPGVDGILEKLLPRYLTAKVKMIILEAFVAEHSARTISMKSATDNAEELLDSLVLLRNKVRQAAITKELIEVISAAEALKG
ncbi:MAG: ATP synthase F1 subunit gamma [Candidatus Omnitrophica bacterium]|nr:ATP synthase F1 subunit gamma [Candidatus Omnitrophota bacterium]